MRQRGREAGRQDGCVLWARTIPEAHPSETNKHKQTNAEETYSNANETIFDRNA